MLSAISSRLPSTPSISSFPKRCATASFPSSVRNPGRHRLLFSLEIEESQLEIDRAVALEALEKLDRQLESLVQQEASPKKRPPSSYSELDLNSDVRMSMRREELPEISGSFLAYSAGFLITLTIVNNLIFNVYVKPSVDGGDKKASTLERVAINDPSE